MKAMVRLVIATLCAAALTPLRAQQTTVIVPVVKGYVQSPGGIPLPDAEVTVNGMRTILHTNAQGAFTIANVPQGALTVSVRRIGYLPAVTEFDIPVENDSLL